VNAIKTLLIEIQKYSQFNQNRKRSQFFQSIEPLMFEFFTLVFPFLRSEASDGIVSQFIETWPL
jgi:hypothetical protein